MPPGVKQALTVFVPAGIGLGSVRGEAVPPLAGRRPVRRMGMPALDDWRCSRLRTEPAHQEAFVSQGRPRIWDNEAEAEVAIEALIAWASEQQRQPSDVRMVLVFNPANRGVGPDTEFAVALR
jgi:hypothetical protein